MGYQSPFELSMILHYSVYVLLGFVCIGAIVRAMVAPLDIFAGPSCGGCGHGVRDMLQGVCPECGGQYAKVGIATPSMAVRMRGSVPVALLAWTTLMATGASFTYGWLEQRAWANYSTASAFMSGTGGKSQESYSTELTPVFLSSMSGRFPQSESNERPEYRLALALNYVMDGEKVDSGTCVLKLRVNGEPETSPLAIDLADGSFTIKDAKGQEIAKGGKDAKVDEATLKKWFQQAGIDVDLPFVQRSLKDIGKIARFARADPGAIESSLSHSFSTGDNGALQSNGSSRSSGGPPGGFVVGGMAGPPGISPTTMVTAAGGLGTVYLLGCGGIVWRNRRMVRR